MNDVAYRINTSLPVKKYGTITVKSGKCPPLAGSGIVVFNNDHTRTVPNESPAGTGLVNRFDDTTYYTA